MASADKKTIEVEPREDLGKGAAKRFRKSGQVPASVYGLKMDPFSVTVPYRRIEEVLHLATGRNTILTLAMSGKNQRRQVMIRDLQRDPVTSRVTHVDFVRVDPNKEVDVNVPIQLIGTAEGVKNEGGILDFVHREVPVSCLPSAIPEHLDVDVSALHLNQHVSVEDIPTTEGVTITADPSMIIAVVSATKVEVTEPEEGAEEEAVEGEAEAPDKEEEGQPAAGE
jgi:large subunit ribosomal protein L25